MGWPGSLGAACMLAALAWGVQTWTQFEQLQLQDVASGWERNREVAPRLETSGTAKSTEPIQHLLRSTDVGRALGSIQTLLTAHGVHVQSADYRVQRPPAGQPASLVIQLSAKASYLKIRGALKQALETTPGLSLQQMTLSRQSSDSGDLEAKIGLAFQLAPESASSGVVR